jgi:signal transduction histidine kinase
MAQQLAVSLYETDGHRIFGEASPGAVSLTPGETRLPLIVSVASLAPERGDGRVVLVSGLALAFLAMLAAGYGLYRATMREVLLARRQSDFVSAVSHEFRTPLTSMRHLTDLLVSRSTTSEERKTQYYELLAHETERLHRMVESLLSFGRIEVGAYAWHLESADTPQFVHGLVEEFRRAPEARDRVVSCQIEEGLPPIQADREALSRAFWNLLENAAKYSAAGSPIRVAARRQGSSVLLAVEDEGSGIPIGERERIFQKFVRGADAKRAGVRGVGIGLALVKRIIEAHGGSVRLESEPGHGSTFTLVLPCPGF